MIKTRFAPSPTGYLHIGGLRTALYSYLIAKQNGGKFLLRIEDTDRERFVADGAANILKSLYWAGLIPDEGVTQNKKGEIVQTGKNGPYIQSERLNIYKKYVDELVEKGHAYPCFCSTERLEEIRTFQHKNKLPTGYDGHCRDLDPVEVKKWLAGGKKHVIRMKMPKEGETSFNDEIKGGISFKNELVDDQVILKSDGFPTYHLAVVIDDHLMEITHIIRGEEWLSSTPKHLKLFEYFGWEAPKMAHLPLLLNADKSKLSKRQGDVAVQDYIDKGYLPEAILNFVAFLGWNPGDERELFGLKDLIKEFGLAKVGKAGAVFNLEKLDWFNQQYLRKMPLEELAERVKPFFAKAGVKLTINNEQLTKIIALERERVATLAEFPEAVKFVFQLPDYEPNSLVWKKSDANEAKKVLSELKDLMDTFSEHQFEKENLEKKMGEWIKEKGYQNGSVLWPLRVSLSGQQNSPGPYEIAGVLGKDESLKRIETAINKF